MKKCHKLVVGLYMVYKNLHKIVYMIYNFICHSMTILCVCALLSLHNYDVQYYFIAIEETFSNIMVLLYSSHRQH